MLAREDQALPRARRIREELGLPELYLPAAARSPSSGSHSARHAKHQLTTLLQAVQKSFAELTPDTQAIAILDDLIRDVGADRGFITFRPEPGAQRMFVSRAADRTTEPEQDTRRHELMEQACDLGEPWPADDVSPSAGYGRRLVFPLFLRTRLVGAVCLERAARGAPFGSADRELLQLLSHQVPIALEITRILAERRRLEASLAQGQRLEALGHLAQSIAHDFNNMLHLIRGALQLLDRREENRVDVEIARSAEERATALTGRLLSFARHKVMAAAPCQVNDAIVEIRPILRRLVGSATRIELHLDPTVRSVTIDRGAFEQALVNLTLNSRDAMPLGGVLSLRTGSVPAADPSLRGRGRADSDHVSIEVTDTGSGIPEELLGQVFDPFFTTKPVGEGRGLGLATVYAFARDSDGFVDVSSRVGVGTTFRLLFPVASGSQPSAATGDHPQ
jgi:signal transduction histidine kinase